LFYGAPQVGQPPHCSRVLAGNSDFSARQYKRSHAHVSGRVECVPYFCNVKHAGNPTAESSETNNNPIN
jgi:hypothetical protein